MAHARDGACNYGKSDSVDTSTVARPQLLPARGWGQMSDAESLGIETDARLASVPGADPAPRRPRHRCDAWLRICPEGLMTLPLAGLNAGFRLGLPLGVPWRLVAVSPGMMDTTFYNQAVPFAWRASSAISTFEYAWRTRND
jgi:hypothetical protein